MICFHIVKLTFYVCIFLNFELFLSFLYKSRSWPRLVLGLCLNSVFTLPTRLHSIRLLQNSENFSQPPAPVLCQLVWSEVFADNQQPQDCAKDNVEHWGTFRLFPSVHRGEAQSCSDMWRCGVAPVVTSSFPQATDHRKLSREGSRCEPSRDYSFSDCVNTRPDIHVSTFRLEAKMKSKVTIFLKFKYNPRRHICVATH